MTTDPKTQEIVKRLVDAAPPLSQRQQDIVSEAFAGALPKRKRGKR